MHQSKGQRAKQARPKAVDFLSESEDAGHAYLPTAWIPKVDDDDAIIGSDGDEDDIDAPRVAQWIDDEDLELDGGTSESDSEENDDPSAADAEPLHRLRSLEDDLSTLPLGTLRNAQRTLRHAQALSDSESDSESSEDVTPDDEPTPTRDGPHGPAKRPNKHAPAEVSSKRPVSRRRMVVDDNFPKSRDPRFMHAAGRYDPVAFKRRYDFLSGLRNDELVTLRDHVKRARKQLANSPMDLRADREREVDCLERAAKRAESSVNLDNRERVELEALQSAKHAEKEKRKQGKTGWWMKQSEKKELLAKARLAAVASAGGRQAVKKALEKKRRKIGQKEKKMRPFPRVEASDGKKRRPVGSVDPGRGVKRRKV